MWVSPCSSAAGKQAVSESDEIGEQALGLILAQPVEVYVEIGAGEQARLQLWRQVLGVAIQAVDAELVAAGQGANGHTAGQGKVNGRVFAVLANRALRNPLLGHLQKPVAFKGILIGKPWGDKEKRPVFIVISCATTKQAFGKN
jgi:hypothetical protein